MNAIRTRLVLLVAAAVAPLLGLVLYDIRHDAALRRDAAGADAARMAELVAADADAFLRSSIRIAERAAAQSRGRPDCPPLFAEFPALDLRYTALVGTDDEGRVVCSSLAGARAPTAAKLPAPWLAGARESEGPFFSEPFSGRVTGRLISVAGVRVAEPGRLRYVVLGIDLATFRPSIAGARFPEGFAITLVGPSGHVLARFPDAPEHVGRRLAGDAFVDAVLAQDSGFAVGPALDGEQAVIGVASVPVSGWRAVVSVPTSAAFAASAEWTRRSLLLAALVALAAIGIGIAAARGVARPIRRLRDAVAAVAAGGSARAPVEGPVEIASVAREFNRLLDARVAAEQAAARTRLDLERVAAGSPVGIFRTDAAGRLTYANARWREIFAAQDGSDLDAAWFDAIAPDERAHVERGWRDAVRAGRPFREEYRLGAHAGTVCWVLATAVPRFVDGRLEEYLGSATDVSELKAAERALKDSERRFALVVQASNAGIWDFDVVGQGIYCSPRLRALLALEVDPSVADLAGLAAYVHADERAMVVGAMRDHLEQRLPFDTECRLRRGDGSYGWFAVRAQAIWDQAGVPIRLAGSVASIDERKAAEAALLRSYAALERRVFERTAELEQANRDLESFSYSVAHDLRAPLRAISGFGAALAQALDGRVAGEEQGYLRHILSRSERMAAMIDDLLELSRVGRREIAIKTVDMEALCDSVVADCAAESARRVIVRRGALPPARGDAALLRHAIENLVANAYKFTRDAAEPCVEITARAEAAGNVYTIADNGAGFDMAYAAKLFGVFQRLHAESEFAGTGIGLAIVQRVATRLGGRVWAEGAPGSGARFHLWLPEAGAREG